MTKRYNLALLSFFTFIILSSSTSVVFSQSINPATYNGSFKVKIGDSNRYDYIKILHNGKNWEPGGFYISPNGTQIPYNITKDVSWFVQVTQINTTSAGLPQVYENQTFLFQGKALFNYTVQDNYNFIFPGFDSYNHAESYFKFLYSNSTTNYTYSRSGNFIELSSSSSYNQTPFLTLTTSNLDVVNWKTGWMEKREAKSILSNGTLVAETLLQRHSVNILSTIIDYSIGLVELGSIVVIIAIPVFIVYNYTKYSHNPNGAHSPQSFFQYLRSRFHYTKKNQKKVTGTETEKSLHTIESILEETKNDTE